MRMSDIRITFLDIGTGDSIAITFTEGGVRRCILVDGGNTKAASRVIANHLADEGVEAIDLLVLSHFDQDHIMGLIYLLRDMANGEGPLEGLPLHNYWGPMPKSTTLEPDIALEGLDASSKFIIQSVKQNEELLVEVERCITDSDAIRFPSVLDPPPLDLFDTFRMELLAPEHQVPAEDVEKAALHVPADSEFPSIDEIETIDDLRRAFRVIQAESSRRADHTANNLSLVLRLKPNISGVKRWRILLTGDAEEESYESIVDRKQSLSARILKVSHHGSRNGTPAWVIPKIRPRYSVMSVGQRYGHPNKEVYRALLRNGNEIFCTEKNMGSMKSACEGFTCPKSGRPGPLSIYLSSGTPHVRVEPDDAFCTDTLWQELGG